MRAISFKTWSICVSETVVLRPRVSATSTLQMRHFAHRVHSVAFDVPRARPRLPNEYVAEHVRKLFGSVDGLPVVEGVPDSLPHNEPRRGYQVYICVAARCQAAGVSGQVLLRKPGYISTLLSAQGGGMLQKLSDAPVMIPLYRI